MEFGQGMSYTSPPGAGDFAASIASSADSGVPVGGIQLTEPTPIEHPGTRLAPSEEKTTCPIS